MMQPRSQQGSAAENPDLREITFLHTGYARRITQGACHLTHARKKAYSRINLDLRK
jgi:hypothetical protein